MANGGGITSGHVSSGYPLSWNVECTLFIWKFIRKNLFIFTSVLISHFPLTDASKKRAPEPKPAPPTKKSRIAVPPPPPAILPAKSPPPHGAANAVSSTAPVTTTASRKVYTDSAPAPPPPRLGALKPQPEKKYEVVTPEQIMLASKMKKAMGTWMSPDHLSKWMMEQHDPVVRLAAPSINTCKISGAQMMKWLVEQPIESRLHINEKLDSVTLKAIRESARKWDPSIPGSPQWPCGCSAHLESVYDDPPIHMGSYADVGNKIKIGRHSDSTYQLSWKDRHREVYMTISRVHCEIVLTQRGWMACDNSENGTFVNDEVVEQGKRKLLKHGDFLSLGPRRKEESNRCKRYRFKFVDLGG